MTRTEIKTWLRANGRELRDRRDPHDPFCALATAIHHAVALVNEQRNTGAWEVLEGTLQAYLDARIIPLGSAELFTRGVASLRTVSTYRRRLDNIAPALGGGGHAT